MKYVKLRIAEETVALSRKPLFAYLRDTQIEPRRRLTFIPYIAHFVLTFADLRLLLTEKHPRDRWQEFVNDHVAEEAGHWEWFLADLETMEMDPIIRFTDALRFIWGRSTTKTRKLSYELCKLAGGSTSLHKLVLLLSVEETAKVAFDAAAVAARELEVSSSKELAYFGHHHLKAEQGHALKNEDTSRLVDKVVLTNDVREELLSMVSDIYRHFGEFVDESFTVASHGDGFATVFEKQDSKRSKM